MLKTTSFEVSKQLLEIGFKQEPCFMWKDKDTCEPFQEGKDSIPSYDLETLIDSLPRKLELPNEKQCYSLSLETPIKGHDYIKYANVSRRRLFCIQKENDLFVNTVAKLILQMHKEGFVNFDEEVIN